MRKLKRKIKYDFTIYTCLLLALILIGYSSYSYLDTHSYSIKDILPKKETITIEEEPKELKKINKKELLNNYIIQLLDKIETDQVLTYDIIHSWNSYEILDIKYKRQITNNYYTYQTNIKINNVKALIPTTKNKELSTSVYIVITLKVNILHDLNNDKYMVKGLDIPKNS